ncbi:hypothetical protein CMUS01_01028 [Colletotrichum musicola]|uniref:Uncharacterized protein n=1 Tax=Colletotrichum musicola TaxID=2175873 RepID=A0A8H6NY19_9PEZI|nr:hypothetical protein CMUS01_01028 [Colletotrichum musicola]
MGSGRSAPADAVAAGAGQTKHLALYARSALVPRLEPQRIHPRDGGNLLQANESAALGDFDLLDRAYGLENYDSLVMRRQVFSTGPSLSSRRASIRQSSQTDEPGPRDPAPPHPARFHKLPSMG